MLFEHGMAAVVFWMSMKLLNKTLSWWVELVEEKMKKKERYITAVYKTIARKSIDWASTK